MPRRIALLIISLLWLPPATAATLAGVNIADSVTVADGQIMLRLNGAGIRSKFFIKLYVGALYLPQASHDAQQIAGAHAPVAVYMHVLHGEIPRAKLQTAWRDGFAANQTTALLAELQPRLERFYEFFPDVHRGDVVSLIYTPATGTRVTVNEQTQGAIEGEDFIQALLQVWLGKHPADEDLKRGMLGLP